MLQLARLYGSGGARRRSRSTGSRSRSTRPRSRVVHANRKLVAAQRQVKELWLHERRSGAAPPPRGCCPTASSSTGSRPRPASSASAAQSARARGARPSSSQRAGELAEASDRSLAASFSPAARTMLGAPATRGGYVFPVGGGPVRRLGRRHSHHDYPAADIAAPEGSPVYALSDARRRALVAVAATPAAGSGFTLATVDGQSWTYCHLSYLDPAVVAGARARGGPARSASSGRPATRPGRTSTCSCSRVDSYPQRACRGSRASPAPPSAGRTRARRRRCRAHSHAVFRESSPTPEPAAAGIGRPLHPVGGLQRHRLAAEGMSMRSSQSDCPPRSWSLLVVWFWATAAFTFAAEQTQTIGRRPSPIPRPPSARARRSPSP